VQRLEGHDGQIYGLVDFLCKARRVDAISPLSSAVSSAPQHRGPPAFPRGGLRLGGAIRKNPKFDCFFGDGASKTGAFHETLNIASC